MMFIGTIVVMLVNYLSAPDAQYLPPVTRIQDRQQDRSTQQEYYDQL